MKAIGGLMGGMVVLLLAATAFADPAPPHAGWPNRGRLGMEVQSMTDSLREYFGAPGDRGILVVRVIPERAAAQAGIQVGDVVTQVGGEPIGEPLDLIAAVARVPAGEKLALEVVRQRKAESVQVAPEGDPVDFERGHHDEDAPAAHPHGEFHDEVLRRLRAIEQRLEQMGSK